MSFLLKRIIFCVVLLMSNLAAAPQGVVFGQGSSSSQAPTYGSGPSEVSFSMSSDSGSGSQTFPDPRSGPLSRRVGTILSGGTADPQAYNKGTTDQDPDFQKVPTDKAFVDLKNRLLDLESRVAALESKTQPSGAQGLAPSQVIVSGGSMR